MVVDVVKPATRKMLEAKDFKLIDYFNEYNQIVIPIYQRNYDWTEEQCQQLLDDIIEIGKRPKEEAKVHFIGSIVYVCNDEYTTEEVEQLVIIDGQQRITTITLMLIALYHFAENEGDNNLAGTIYDYYLINRNATDDSFKIKLKATDNNERDVRLLLDNRPIPNSEYSNIKNNYNFFMKNITKENRDLIYEGFRRLLFVEIRLERGKDNAQKIFESLNSTGLDLSQADLIRNYILMGLEPAEQTRLFNRYWAIIESNTKLDGTSYVSDFIRDFLTMKFGDIPNKNRVYYTFKHKFRIEENLNLDEILGEILNYSDIYKMLINPQIISDSDIRREISYLKYIEVNVSYPFLLQVIDDYLHEYISKEVLLNILKFIQSYVCRRFILDLPTNALNKIFMTLYKQINKEDYENSLYYHILTRSGKVRIPTDAEILNYLRDKDLYNARSKMKLYILERMENFETKEPITIIGNSDITIEHIFPQKPEAVWKKELGDAEYKSFLERYLHTIGNLTLSGNNGALGNKTFLEKKHMNKDGGEQGYIFSRLWLNRSLRDFNEWNISNYNSRTQLLENRFLSIWPLPKVNEIKDIPEFNICEMDLSIVTGKDIEYAIFFGKKLSGDKYKGIKLYNYIIKELFIACAEDEFISKFGNILRLTENEQELHRCQSLNSTYYYDTNLSYHQMFSNLKKILVTLDMTDELYIKLRIK